MYRLAIVASHPIQYQAPWFRALAETTDLTVFFCHRQQPADQAKAGFGVAFDWDVPLLQGYRHEWLTNRSSAPDVSRAGGCDTPEIGDILRDGNFDACIVSGWYLKSYIQAIHACRRHRIPVLLRGDSHLHTPRPKLVSFAKYLPYRWLLGGVDGHLYVGTANKDYLRHFGVPESRLFFVPHFVDNDFFAERAARAREAQAGLSLRASLGAGESTSLFLFGGKLIQKKRPLDFVRALALAREKTSEVAGVVVGDGPLFSETQELTRRLSAPVAFAGFRNQTELPAYFAASDGLVLPSDGRETWGLVVNEAMACGLPAVVSRAAGCAADLIDDGETGYQVDVGNVDQLSQAMLAVHDRRLRDPQSFRPAVLKKISHYTIAAAVKGTLGAVQTVVDRRRTTGAVVRDRRERAAQ
jgi:glycosyltransferase involved in cell wall biosynthesis